MIGDAHNYTYPPRTEFSRPMGRIDMTAPISPFMQDDATVLDTPHEIRRHDISLSMPPLTPYHTYQPRLDTTPRIPVFSQNHATILNTPYEPHHHEISMSMPPHMSHYGPSMWDINPILRADLTNISMFTLDDEEMLNTPREFRRHEISRSGRHENPLSVPPLALSPAGGIRHGHDFSSGSATRFSHPGRSIAPASTSEYHDDPSAALLALNFDDSDARGSKSTPQNVVVSAHNAAKIHAMRSMFLDILAANRINARQYSLLCSTTKMDTGSRNALIEQLYHVQKRLTPEQYAIMKE